MTDQLILGAGEVGRALAQVLDCDLRDEEPKDGLLDRYEILHIAYPWQIPDFVSTTIAYEDKYRPDYVVVHSTVPVGMCASRGWIHSPVRGRHPDLAEGLLAFVKHFGGEGAEHVARQWTRDTDRAVKIHELAATTEAAKLFELAQYGMEIVMQKEIYEFCAENNLPFDEVYNDFGHSYNDGWKGLGQYHFIKPLLEHTPGPIGGHCVLPGARMLPDYNFQQYVTSAQDELEREAK